MGRNRLPRPVDVFDDRRQFIGRFRLAGFATVLVGLSQLPVAVLVADATGHDSLLLVIGGGGWLLVGIGVNILRGREAFETRRDGDGWWPWLSAIVTVIVAISVAVAAALLVLSTGFGG